MAKIHFLNVDEGDCSIIQHDNGKVTMIDICCGNIVEQQSSGVTFSTESVNTIKGNFNMKAYPTNPVEYIKDGICQTSSDTFRLTQIWITWTA